MSNPADSLPPPIPPIRRLDTLQGPTLRAVLIGLIWVLLWVPLGMLDDLRAERHEHAEAAARTIAEGWGGLHSRADFAARQAERPIVIAMNRPEQRARVVAT